MSYDVFDDDIKKMQAETNTFLQHWSHYAKNFVFTWVGLRQDLKVLRQACEIILALLFRIFLFITLPVSSAFFAFMQYLYERPKTERKEIWGRIGYTCLFMFTMFMVVWVAPYAWQHYVGK